MDVKIALFNRGLMANFSVEQQDTATYTIRLKSFEGESQPPLYMKMYKTSQGWESAFDDKELIRELGLAIEVN